jgi:hypothetical protein
VSAECSTGAPRNVRNHLMERRWRSGHVALSGLCGGDRKDGRPRFRCRGSGIARSL